jgi:hypothetical protein
MHTFPCTLPMHTSHAHLPSAPRRGGQRRGTLLIRTFPWHTPLVRTFPFTLFHTDCPHAHAQVGIDVTCHVLKNLIGEQPRYLGVRMEGADLGIMDEFVSAGLLGKKAGKGFFDHSAKDKKGAAKPIHPEAKAILDKYRHPTLDFSKAPVEDAIERIALRFCLEAVHCLQDGIISSARDGDIGASARAPARPTHTGCPPATRTRNRRRHELLCVSVCASPCSAQSLASASRRSVAAPSSTWTPSACPRWWPSCRSSRLSSARTLRRRSCCSTRWPRASPSICESTAARARAREVRAGQRSVRFSASFSVAVGVWARTR